jgi:Holliday junction resolvase-like predicted endonuclease
VNSLQKSIWKIKIINSLGIITDMKERKLISYLKMRKKRLLIFAEVKTRRNKNFGNPEESINIAKQDHIKKAAMGFVSENENYSDHDLRIDVISILLVEGKAEIEHFENAF